MIEDEICKKLLDSNYSGEIPFSLRVYLVNSLQHNKGLINKLK